MPERENTLIIFLCSCSGSSASLWFLALKKKQCPLTELSQPLCALGCCLINRIHGFSHLSASKRGTTVRGEHWQHQLSDLSFSHIWFHRLLITLLHYHGFWVWDLQLSEWSSLPCFSDSSASSIDWHLHFHRWWTAWSVALAVACRIKALADRNCMQWHSNSEMDTVINIKLVID